MFTYMDLYLKLIKVLHYEVSVNLVRRYEKDVSSAATFSDFLIIRVVEHFTKKGIVKL